MAFVGAIVAIAMAVVGELLRPKQSPPNARASSLDDLELPTAEEGRALYAFAGRCRIDAPNVVWYGDLGVYPIVKKVKTGWFSSAKQTIGHQYKMGIAFGIAFSRDDLTLHKITIGSKDPKHTITDEGNGCLLYYYNDYEFWGGEQAEGGVNGPIRFYRGTDTQTSNAYMSARLGETYPAYRGFCHAVAEHFWWGNTPYIKPIAWELSSYPNQLGVPSNHHKIGTGENIDANPICMIYELLTDPVWGAGNPTSDIDTANFLEMAETIYQEGYGMSMVYSGTATAKEYITEILRHIDGVMFTNPKTGLLEIALARGGYDIDTLPTLTRDDFAEGISFGRPSWEETKNTLKTTYTDRSAEYVQAVISMQDLANIMIRGEVAPEAIDFTGFSRYEPASIATARSLKSISYPLAHIDGPVLRMKAGNFKPADVVRVYWPELGLNGNVFRITDITYSSTNTNSFPVKLAEDIFSISDVPYVQPPASGWVDPAQPPQPVTRQKLFELPYQFTGTDGMFVATLASRAQNIDTGYRVFSGTTSGDVNLTQKDEVLDWTASGILVDDYPNTTASQDATGFQISDPRNFEAVEESVTTDVVNAGDRIALIASTAGNELVAFRNWNPTTRFLTNITRAVYGTGKLSHPAGATVWILSDGFGLENPDTPYTTLPRTVYAKLLTFNMTGSLPIASATQMSLALTGIAKLQNAPYNLQAEGSATPPPFPITGDIDFTWDWRDKYVDGGRINVSGSTPFPAGLTFRVRVYNGTTLLRTVSGLTAATWTYTAAMLSADGDGTRDILVTAVDANGETAYTSLTIVINPPVVTLVKSLLHFNGSFIDEVPETVWTEYASGWMPTIDATDVKFGSGAMKLAVNKAIKSPAAPSFRVGTGDFTIEAFVYFRTDTFGQRDIYNNRDDSNGITLRLDGGKLDAFWGAGFNRLTGATTVSLNTWYHVALCRSGNNWYLFLDGVLQASGSLTAGTDMNGPANVGLGVYVGYGIGTGDFSIDDFRFTNGFARYTSAFTPPASPLTVDM